MMRRRPGPKPVEPLWPHGAIAQMVVVPAELSDTGQVTMGLRKLTVTNATKTPEGWRIVAQSPNRIVRFLDVDEEGIGSDCEPWDDELERKFGPADPEHNVVLLDNEQPAEPAGEVIDINAKWAERDDKIRRFVESVNALRRPSFEQAEARSRRFVEAVSEGQAADRPAMTEGERAEEAREANEHRLNVDAFRERVARLVSTASTEEFREGAINADAVVRFYNQIHPHSAPKFTDQVDDLLTGYEELFRALPVRRRDLSSGRQKTGTEIFNEFFAERDEDPSSREKRIQALAALSQRGQELMRAGRKPGSVVDSMIRGVTRASERREAERKEAASRMEEAEQHGNA